MCFRIFTLISLAKIQRNMVLHLKDKFSTSYFFGFCYLFKLILIFESIVWPVMILKKGDKKW